MKLKLFWGIFIVFSLEILSLRFYQVANKIEIPNDFYNSDNPIIKCIALSFIIYILALLILSYIPRQLQEQWKFRKNIFSGISAIITSGLLFILASNNLMTFVQGNYQNVKPLSCVLLILSGINFFLIAVGSFTGKNLFNKRLWFLSFWSSLWIGLQALNYTFVGPTNQNIFIILALLATLLFLFTEAKLLSGIVSSKTVRRTMTFGMISIVLLSTYIVPEILTLLDGTIQSNLLENLLYVSLIIYIFSFLLELSSLNTKSASNKNDNQDVDQNQPTDFQENLSNTPDDKTIDLSKTNFTSKQSDQSDSDSLNDYGFKYTNIIKNESENTKKDDNTDMSKVDMDYINKIIDQLEKDD